MKKFIPPVIFIFAIFVICFAPFVGMQSVTPSDIFNDGVAGEIFRKIRLPRVLMSFIAGSILAVGGLVFQAMFRNPIATPFTLGVSSGASLGTALYFFLGFSLHLPGFLGGSIFAFLGASFAILIVYGTARLSNRNDNVIMLLTGVALNFLCSSLIMFIQYSVDLVNSHKIMYYTIGSLSGSRMNDIYVLAPLAVIGFTVIMAFRRELDLFSMGEETAAARGVNTRRVSAILYFTVSVMVACTVSLCGPIGFVGMMAPHICRMMTGTSNMRLLPLSIAFGGAFLTICDTAARTLYAPVEMPVGIITSMLGAPFFIFLIIKKHSL